MTEKYYLTQEGLERIKSEYEALCEFKKLKTKGEVPVIWESEDVNPEYLAFQEDMSLLETRLMEHENILKNYEIIQPPKAREKRHQVELGATVTVDLGGELDEFMIVGTLEADPLQKRISNMSPLGSGLIGARVGDTIKVKTTLINHDCRILKILYR